jgi:uncharacterized membrane protein
MESFTIIAGIIGVLLACFLIFVEEAFEEMLNPVLSLFGLGAHCGSLRITIKQEDFSGEKVQSQLQKNFVKGKLSPGASLTVYANKPELVDSLGNDLSMIDVHGKVCSIIPPQR